MVLSSAVALAAALLLLLAGLVLLGVWKADTWIPFLLGRLDGFLTRHKVGTWWATVITRTENYLAKRRRERASAGDPPTS